MKKKFIIGIVIFVGIILTTLLVLEYVVDLNTFSPKITAIVEDSLHRKIELGDISLSLLRGPGARVQNVEIFEQDQIGRFVQAKDITARVKLLPLLSKKVEVAKVILDEPVVTIKRTLSGGWNFDDLLGTSVEASPVVPEPSNIPAPSTPVTSETPKQPSSITPAPAATPSQPESVEKKPSPLSQFALDTFQLNDGTITFIDEMMHVTTELSNIQWNMKDVALNSPIQFQMSADVDGGSQGKIQASGKFGPIPADGNIEQLELDLMAKLEEIDLAHFGPYYQDQVTIGAEKLNANLKLAGNLGTMVASTGNVSVGDVKVDVTGKVEQPQKSPKVDLTVTMSDFPWEKLLQLLPPDIGKQLKELGLSGVGNLKIQPKGSLDKLVVSGEFDLSKSGIQYQQLFAKPEALKMTLKFDTALTMDAARKPKGVEIPSLQLTIGDFVLTVSGNVTNLMAASPTLDLKVATNEFALPKLMALFPEFSQTKDAKPALLTSDGTGVLTAAAQGTLDALSIQATVNLDKGKVFYGDLFHKEAGSAGNIVLDAHLGKDALDLKNLVVHLGDFQLTTTGSVEHFAQPVLDLKVATNEFDIGKLVAFLPVAASALPPELKLGGAGKLSITAAGSLEDVTATGALDMSKGEIRFGKDPAKPDFAKPKDMPGIIEFDTNIKQMDVVQIKKLRLNLNEVILDITGSVSDLKQETMLDLRIKSNVFTLNQLTPLMANLGVNPTGKTELDLALKTPLKHINLASLITGTLRLTDAGVSAPQLPKPVKKLNAQVKIQGDTVTVQKFSAAIGESSLQGDVTVKKLFTTPDIVFALHAPKLNIDELLPPDAKKAVYRSRAQQTDIVDLRPFRTSQKEGSPFLRAASQKQTLTPTKQGQTTSKTPPQATATPAKALAEAKPQSSGGDEFLTRITTNGTLKVDQGQAKNVRFAKLSADVKMLDGVLNVDNLLFSLYDGDYTGGLQLDLTEPDPKYDFHSEFVHVDTNPLLTDSASLSDVMYGLMFANLTIGGQGFTPGKLIPSLTGKGYFKVEQGKFTTFDVWSELALVFQTIGSVAQIQEMKRIGDDLARFPDETSFSRFQGSFDLKNGNAGSSDLVLEVPEQDMHITLLLAGTFGLDTTLDFMGKVRFDPKSKYYKDIERNFRDFKQDDGGIILPFPIPIGGTLLKPKIDRQSIQKSLTVVAGEMAKQAVKSEIQDQLKEQVTDRALELLTGKKPTPVPTVQDLQPTPQPPSAAPKPTPTPTPKPEDLLKDVGKDLLKDLLKKKK